MSIWLAWSERQFQTQFCDHVKITMVHKKVVTNNSKDTASKQLDVCCLCFRSQKPKTKV